LSAVLATSTFLVPASFASANSEVTSVNSEIAPSNEVNKKVELVNGHSVNVVENGNTRVATTLIDNKITEATLNLETYMLTTKVTDSVTGAVIEEASQDLSQYLKESENLLADNNSVGVQEPTILSSNSISSGISALASVSVLKEENTYSNFEYTKYSNKTWELRRPNKGAISYYYKKVTETTKNSKAIGKFHDSVEKINTLEATALGLIGMSGMALLLGAALGPAGVIASEAVFAALGFSGGSLAAIYNLKEEMENAYDLYFDI
ncbi:MAG: geobacillin-26 family protein, partial [Psychrobacillus psychrodurans]